MSKKEKHFHHLLSEKETHDIKILVLLTIRVTKQQLFFFIKFFYLFSNLETETKTYELKPKF